MLKRPALLNCSLVAGFYLFFGRMMNKYKNNKEISYDFETVGTQIM
jgi:hypothetical protein